MTKSKYFQIETVRTVDSSVERISLGFIDDTHFLTGFPENSEVTKTCTLELIQIAIEDLQKLRDQI